MDFKGITTVSSYVKEKTIRNFVNNYKTTTKSIIAKTDHPQNMEEVNNIERFGKVWNKTENWNKL